MWAKEIEAIHPKNSDARSGLFGAIAALMAALLSMASAAMIYRAATSANHWGLDIRLLWPVCAAAAIYAGINLRRMPASKGPAVALLVTGITTAALVFILDHFNLLVEYSEWLRRGMP